MGTSCSHPLPYTDDHLEPYIGERTVRYHYYRHLQAYIDKVNALAKEDFPGNSTIEDIIRTSYGPLFDNASQVFNHYFYFEQINPEGIKQPMPMMEHLIEKHYGSLGKLKAQLLDAGMSIFGSGWVFLTTDQSKSTLWVRPFVGTDTPLVNSSPCA